MDTVAIYCRLSKEERDRVDSTHDSSSIRNQKSVLIHYAIQQKWSIYKIYSDEDYSGADANRPKFNQLLHDAKAQKFNIVLCKNQSRFTRDMELVEKYIHNRFVNWGVRFIGLLDGADSNDKGNKKARQINGLLNDWYLEDLSENVKSVLTDKRKRGHFIGALLPYGYLRSPEDKTKLVIDPDASKVVKKIFGWYLEGVGVAQITRNLNVAKVPNPTLYKKQQGHSYKPVHPSSRTGHIWTHGAVRYILKNRIYIGDMVQGKQRTVSYKNHKTIRIDKKDWIVVENTHAPIIDRETFLKVQDTFLSNSTSIKKGEAYPLARKVKCKFCGCSMYKKNYKKVPYVYCKSNSLLNGSCISVSVKYSFIESIILKKLKSTIGNQNLSEYFNELGDRIKVTLCKLKSQRQSILNKSNKLNEVLTSIYTDKVIGKISEDEFIMQNQSLIIEDNDTNNKLMILENDIFTANEAIEKYYGLAKALSGYQKLDKLDRNLAELLIDFVEVGYQNDSKNKIIDVHWNF